MPPLEELQSHFKSHKPRGGTRLLAAGLLASILGITGTLAIHSSASTQFAAAGAATASNFQDAVNRAYSSLCPFLNLCSDIAASNSHSPRTTEIKPSLVTTANPTPSPRRTESFSTSSTTAITSSQPPVIQTITNPIRERVVEKVVTTNAHSDSWFTLQLASLENKLSTQIASVGSRIIPVSGPNAPVSVTTFAASQNIGNLSNTTITNPTISGGTISGASISGTISAAISSALATISDLTATTLVATNVTFTYATTTNLAVTGTATIGAGTGMLQTTSGVVSAIANGAEGQVLKIVGGIPAWGISTGGTGGSSAWATTTNNLAVYTADPTQVVLIGTSATSTAGNILEVKGNSLVRGNITAQGIAAASSFTATSTANSSLPNVTHTNSTTTNATTTTFAATSASTTNLTTGALTIGALSGFLKATTGVIASALVNLATDITGILPVGNGGTGWAALASGAIPYGNGSAALATTSAGTAGQVLALLNGVPTWTATSTLATISGLLNLSTQTTGSLGVGNGGTGSTTLSGILKGSGSSQVSSAVAGADYEVPLSFSAPLSRSVNAISISTSGDWAGTLGTFAASQLIALGFSTTSADAWRLTRNFYSTTSADYWLTQKTTDNLTQGSTNKYYATALFATDLAGTTTDALAEGSGNLYFTNSRVQTFLNSIDKGYFFSTTSASNFLSLNSGSAFSTTSANYWKTANDFFSTTSSAYFLSVNQGPAFSTTSASYFLTQNTGNGFSTTSATYFAHSSTTIPKTYTANAFTALQTFANASTTNISATYASSTQALFGSLSVGNLTGVIRAASGLVSAGFIGLGSDVIGILPVGYGGTGTSSTPTYGKLLVGNTLGGYDLLATSSLGISGGGPPTWGAITGTLSNQTDLQTALNAKFDLSAWYATTTNALAEGGNNLYFTNGRVQTYLNSVDKGFFFSTTSSNFWKAANDFFSTTSASNFLSLNTGTAFSTTSANYWKTANDFFSTTSSAYFLSVNQGPAFSTSSASFFLAQNTGNGFSTTSASYFAHASTTIPKTYTSNIFTGLQIFTSGVLATASTTIGNGTQATGLTINGGATTTGNLIVQGSGTSTISNDLTAGNLASTGYLTVTGASSLTSVNLSGLLNSTYTSTSTFASGLQATALNLIGSATSTASNGFNLSAGCFSINGSCLTSGPSSLFAYLFPNNATTTGLGIYASTTIGNGSQVGGLTISGSATTTGNAFIAGKVGIGTTSPYALLSVVGEVVAQKFTATSTAATSSFTSASFAFASSTQGFFGSLSLGSLSGILKATTGAISSALVNLATDITGILPVGNGGTGWAALAAGAIPYGNGSSALATTSAGTAGQVLALLNGVPTWTATSTLATISGLLNLSSQITGALGVGNGGTGSTTITGLLKGAGTSALQTAIPGTDYQVPISATFPLLFSSNALSLAFGTTTANSWSQLQIFPVGFLSPATTTIGNGTQAGGLTISGGATTTGNAYFGGNVGIGTTTPNSLLTLSAAGSNAKFRISDTNGSGIATISLTDASGDEYSIGRDGPTGFLDFNGTQSAFSGYKWRVSSGTEVMRINNIGNVGIGTTSPAHQLTTTGSVQFATFGAGTLTTDAIGNLSVSSDERLKNIQGNFSRSLDDLLKLNPILYHWKTTSGLEQGSLYAGFSAQNVQSAIPEAVGSSTSGYLTLQDRPLIATLVNAIKEIATLTGIFKANLIAWLADTTNGIHQFFADIGNFHTVNTDQLCVGSGATATCINQSQLAALLTQSTAAGLANSSQPSTPSGGASATSSGTNLQGPDASSSTNLQDASTTSSATSPVIHINGNNPATLTAGSTYADLGATIVSPAADTNLGITTLVDNATSTAGTGAFDTTTAGTHTITYTVTDSQGLTGAATRTVIVAVPANDNTAISPQIVVPPPTNDNPQPTLTSSATSTAP